jgi:Tfp pilus assembly protein PilN
MREIDFLPTWYPQIQQRHRRLIVQGWITLVILSMLVGYALLKRWQVHSARIVTQQCQAQITLSRQQLAQLSEKLKYEAELRQQDQIVARLGLGVDSTRLLKSLEDAMTPEMSLTNLSLETVEQPRPTAVIGFNTRNPNASVTKADGSEVDRRLKVVVDGVAPSDMQVAALMENLAKINCFENVAFPYLREGRSRDGHVTREFEVTFELNLDPPAESSTPEDRP